MSRSDTARTLMIASARVFLRAGESRSLADFTRTADALLGYQRAELLSARLVLARIDRARKAGRLA